jgi:lycopene elongase
VKKTIKVLFMTSRPLSWVDTAYPFATGYLVMGGAIHLRLIVGTLFFLIPYNLLMYGINDVCDYESDMRNPRKGGVEGAVTPRRYHQVIVWLAVLSCLPFVLTLVIMGNWQSGLVLTVVLFFVVAYSATGLRFKEVPLLDSVTSSLHFVGPLLYAYSLVGTTQAGWLAASAFFCWGMASQAFGAVQDIVPDREAEICSIATFFGARVTVWLAMLLYVAAIGLVACLGVAAWPVLAAGGLYIINLLPFVQIRDERSAEARTGWRRFLWLNYFTGAVVTMTLLMIVWDLS